MADSKGPDEGRFNQLADSVEEFTNSLLDPLRADRQRREEFGDALDEILDDAIQLKQKKVIVIFSSVSTIYGNVSPKLYNIMNFMRILIGHYL